MPDHGLAIYRQQQLVFPLEPPGPAGGHHHTAHLTGVLVQIQIPNKDIRTAAQPVQQGGTVLTEDSGDGAAAEEGLLIGGVLGFQIPHLVDHYLAAVGDLPEDFGCVGV